MPQDCLFETSRRIRINVTRFLAGKVQNTLPRFGVIWSGLYFTDAINLQTALALALILLGIAVSRKGN